MSLLNLFWQCSTDLKAPVIIPLCITLCVQRFQNRVELAQPWEKGLESERHVAKIACHSGDPS